MMNDGEGSSYAMEDIQSCPNTSQQENFYCNARKRNNVEAKSLVFNDYAAMEKEKLKKMRTWGNQENVGTGNSAMQIETLKAVENPSKTAQASNKGTAAVQGPSGGIMYAQGPVCPFINHVPSTVAKDEYAELYRAYNMY